MEALKNIISEKQKKRAEGTTKEILNVKTENEGELESQLASEVIPLTSEQIVFRLRKLKQPALLFGEDIKDQYHRLQRSESDIIDSWTSQSRISLDFNDIPNMFEGNQNLFYESEYLDQGKECQRCEDSGLVWKKEKWLHPFVIEATELKYSEKALVVMMWWKKIVSHWDGVRRSEEKGVFELTVSWMVKFAQLLRVEAFSDDIVGLFFVAVRFCQIFSYVRALDTHLKISNSLSFVSAEYKGAKRLSEQSFRKITQTFKRLLSLSQKFFTS